MKIIQKQRDKYVKMVSCCEEVQKLKPKEIEGVWIPTQDDIQLLFKKANLPKYINCVGNDMKLDVFLRTTLSKYICCGGFHRMSFNEAWLQFYMIEVHGKRWMSDPQKWITLEK